MYAIDSASEVLLRELRLRSDELLLHADSTCKHCGFRTAISELLARHLRRHTVHPPLQQSWRKVKSSMWPRDHRVERLVPPSWCSGRRRRLNLLSFGARSLIRSC
ncbi:hypothetical protein IG631_24136 [Alternaria alternata]|nr:hypothetical protein IG631_24136 [Alternaria alternata]